MYSGINEDGSLKKFSTPTPTSVAAKAASSGDIDTLKTLSKSDLLAIDEHGNSALIWAADKGHTDALDLILNVISNEERSESEQSIHLNLRGYLGNTAIARASRGGHVDCVESLIAQSMIDPNICNEKMQFPLHFGAFKKHRRVVEVLLESGKCDTFVKDRKDRTPVEDTSVEEIKNMILAYRENKK